jgi:hypothetical protein
MDASETHMACAEALVRRHFDDLNKGDLASAKEQLFWPHSMEDRPVDVYLQTMVEMRPFKIVSLTAHKFHDVRMKRHGAVATVFIHIIVMCSLGERSSDMSVWWWPESNNYQIATRPTEWVLERLKATGRVAQADTT